MGTNPSFMRVGSAASSWRTSTLLHSRYFCSGQTRPHFFLLRRQNSVDGLLELLIAADYLSSKSLEGLTQRVAAHLAVKLLLDRRKLTSAHLNIVVLYNTSPNGWANAIWEMFVKAGVRPFLQDFFADLGESSIKLWEKDQDPGYGPAPGHGDVRQWKEIVLHCRQLRKVNDKYALQVADSVVKMLKEGRLAAKGMETQRGLTYVDPLYLVEEVSLYKIWLDDTFSFRFAV